MLPDAQMVSLSLQCQKRAYRTRKTVRSYKGCRERRLKVAMLRAMCLISPNASHCDASNRLSCTEYASGSFRGQSRALTNKQMSNTRSTSCALQIVNNLVL